MSAPSRQGSGPRRGGTGLAARPLSRPAPADGHAGAGALARLRAPAAAGLVPVDEIQFSPDNPATRHEVGEGLVASVRAVGVIQDLLLVTREDWLRDHPEHTDRLTDAPYVALAGNRRLAAARAAGRSEVPARIRADLTAQQADGVVLHENIHRVELTASMEGEAYRRQIDRHGLSQRQLAQHLGVSQPQISRKVRLLDLPEPVVAEVDAGRVPLEQALTLLEEDDEVAAALVAALDGPGDRGFPAMVLSARQEVADRRRRAQAEQHAAAEGVRFLDDPEEVFPAGSWRHRLHTAQEIEEARERGDLAVGTQPRHDGEDPVAYYRVSVPAQPEPTDPETAERARDRQRRAAAKARRAVLADLVTVAPPPPQMRSAVLAHTLRGRGWDADTARVAVQLTRAAGLTSTEHGTEYPRWAEELRSLTGRRALHAAWIITLAYQEAQASYTWRAWDAETHAYLALLVEHGHTPSTFEADKVKDAGGAGE